MVGEKTGCGTGFSQVLGISIPVQRICFMVPTPAGMLRVLLYLSIGEYLPLFSLSIAYECLIKIITSQSMSPGFLRPLSLANTKEKETS